MAYSMWAWGFKYVMEVFRLSFCLGMLVNVLTMPEARFWAPI